MPVAVPAASGADGAVDITMVQVPPVTGTTLVPNHDKGHDYSIAELVTSGLPPSAATEGSFLLAHQGEPADQHSAYRRRWTELRSSSLPSCLRRCRRILSHPGSGRQTDDLIGPDTDTSVDTTSALEDTERIGIFSIPIISNQQPNRTDIKAPDEIYVDARPLPFMSLNTRDFSEGRP